MTTKKWIRSGVLAAVLVSGTVLGGCSGSDGEPGSAAHEVPAPGGDITVLGAELGGPQMDPCGIA